MFVIPIFPACFRDPRAWHDREHHAESAHQRQGSRERDPFALNRQLDAPQHHVRSGGQKRDRTADKEKDARRNPDRASGHGADSNSRDSFVSVLPDPFSAYSASCPPRRSPGESMRAMAIFRQVTTVVSAVRSSMRYCFPCSRKHHEWIYRRA